MINKLTETEDRYEVLNNKLIDPSIMKDMELWKGYVKEHGQIEPMVLEFRKFKDINKSLEELKEMPEDSEDEDFESMVKDEIQELSSKLTETTSLLEKLLTPEDPNNDSNVIIEIRAGAGGDEGGIFAGDLFRMYSRFAEIKGWQTEILSANNQGVGGFKEVSLLVNGKGAYRLLKYESGVHRVQRVPDTESSGRIHTSTATVAVLLEADDVDVVVEQNDLKTDVFRSSGNGGQHVNTTDSAVRLTHIPTGLVVSCQDGKSQLKNKESALKVLKARLYDMMIEKHNSEIAKERRSQVGSGGRSSKIRTYNFPQGRITDHRINLTVHNIDKFLDGELDVMIDSLITEDNLHAINHS